MRYSLVPLVVTAALLSVSCDQDSAPGDGYDEIRVFGLDGVHIRTFGRDGEGPGEFGRVGLDSGGDTGDTVPWVTASGDLPGLTETIVCEWESGIGFYPHTAGAKFVQHPASGGIMYSAWGYFCRVAVTRSDGDTLRVIERTLPTEPVTDEEWAAGSAEFEESRERWPDASCNPRSYSRPERMSFIEEIFVAPDGKLWVEVVRNAGNRWEFFDPEGRLLGSVPAVPHKDRTVPVFSGDHLATIRQDDPDLDHVDIWRLERVGRE